MIHGNYDDRARSGRQSSIQTSEESPLDPKLIRIGKIIALILVLGVIAYFVLPVSVPIILAFFTAAILEPIIRWGGHRLKLKRRWMVLLTFSAFFSALVTVSYLFVSRGITELIRIAERIPYYTWMFIGKWNEWNESFLSRAEQELPLPVMEQWQRQLDNFLFNVTEPLRTFDYLNLMTKFGTWLPMFMISVLVYLIAVFLFMMEMPRVIRQFYEHLKEETARKFRLITERLISVTKGFFKAQLMISTIIFVSSFIGLLFIVPPRVAITVALLLWLIDFVPIIGSVIILVPWTLFELIIGNTYTFYGLAILTVILVIIRRISEPKVMGQYIGLSPLATLISMFLGAKLLGIAGLLLGPMLWIAYRTMREVGIIKFEFKI